MRKLLLLALIGCNSPEVTPDASDACVYRTACDAARKVAESYCNRQLICWGEHNDRCVDQVLYTMCQNYDCAAYYPDDNLTKLEECLRFYDAAPCDGPKPSVCKLY